MLIRGSKKSGKSHNGMLNLLWQIKNINYFYCPGFVVVFSLYKLNVQYISKYVIIAEL